MNAGIEFKEYHFKISSGTVIYGWSYTLQEPRGVLHILHGMMEHSLRYRQFAEWMAENGFAVYAADHPGHGRSVGGPEDLGHLDDDTGWQEIMEAVCRVQDRIREEYSGVPVFMMGHSFGSAVARSFAQEYGQQYPLSGLILSGAMQQPSFSLRAGLGLIAAQKAWHGSRHRSKLLITLGHGQYAKFFSPNRSKFDWLSGAEEVVKIYDDDPLCGYACSLGYYRNFFRALLKTWDEKNIRKMNSELPVLFIGGNLDPAIRFGKDTRLLSEKYQRSGIGQVKVKLFKTGRHEMLNEANHLEVYGYLKEWMVQQLFGG